MSGVAAGEMKMDAYYRSQGYTRINLDKVTSLDMPMHQGIDGNIDITNLIDGVKNTWSKK